MKQTYNREGKGKLLGYASDPQSHEEKCEYRRTAVSMTCNCKAGLWTQMEREPHDLLAMG